jgi:hypothetical protein
MHSYTLSLTSALDGVVDKTTPRPLYSRERDPMSVVQEEVVWAPGPVWASAENLALTGIRSPALPNRNESLYRLIGYFYN